MAEQEKLAQLIVQMELQSAAFERGIKEVARKMDGLDKEAKQVNKTFGKLDKTFSRIGKGLAGLAASISVLGIAAATKEAFDFADGLAKTADKVGVSVEALQKLRFAAGQAGVDTNVLDLGLQRFSRRLGEAAQGTGELYKDLERLGISVKNLDGSFKSTEQVLYEYGDAIGEAESAQERLRLGVKAFDSEGAGLSVLFRDGSAAVRELGDELERAGGLLSEEAARAAEVANDKFDKLATVIKAKVTTAFIEATEAALEFFDIFLDVDPAKLRLKELNAELEVLQDKLANGPARSRNATQQAIRKLKEEIADLEAQIKKLSGGDASDAVSTSNGPLAALKRDITGMDEELEVLAASMRSVEASLNGIGEAALKFAEPSILAKGGFLDQLSESLNPTATDEAIASLGNLADIGVIFGDVAEEGEDAFDRLIEATDGFARDFTQTLTTALLEGEARFDDFAKNVLKTIADILLTEIFNEFFSIIAGGIKSYFGVGTTSGGDDSFRLAAYAPMSVPGMTREGEAYPSMIVGRIQPSGGFKSTNASPVTVNVNNYGKDDVEIEQRNTNNGIEIDVLIKNTVKNGFSDGSFDRVMQTNFGARRLGY